MILGLRRQISSFYGLHVQQTQPQIIYKERVRLMKYPIVCCYDNWQVGREAGLPIFIFVREC